jgi:hypothetical protein
MGHAGIVAGRADIVLRFVTDEWREAVPPRRLSALLARLQRLG